MKSKMAGHRRTSTGGDLLTKLPTRGFFQRRLRQEIDEARRTKRSLGLCVLGLDRFREINHTFGPHYGDALLRDVARRFTRVTSESNARARLNSDEFAALFPDVTLPRLEVICSDILRALDPPFIAQGIPIDLSGSV